MLSVEITLKLIADAQNGSDEAKTALLVENMPLIKSIAKRYLNKQIEYDDIVQLGRLGFVKAINNFDTQYGVRFSTYAVPMIAGEIKRFIRDNGAIKVSRSIKAQNIALNKFIEEYRQKNNTDPTVKEIAEAIGVEETDVFFIMDSAKYPVSIYSESDDEEGISLIDKLPAKYDIDMHIEKMALRDIIDNFDARDKKIIYLRYYRDKTQS